MGWLPQAIRRDVGAPANYSNGPMRSYLGVVLHVNDANSGDLYDWITGNHNMSCHWQVLKDGTVYQYIDTRYSSWCQGAGNDDYLSIETSGFPTEPLTAAQVQACGAIMAFAHGQHSIPLQLAEKPGDRGLGWHGMGAPAWGHAACPGDLRKAQRTAVLGAAGAESGSSGGATKIGDDMPLSDAEWARLQDMINNALLSQRAWITANYGGVPAALSAFKPEIIGLRKNIRDTALALGGQLTALPDGTPVTSIGAALLSSNAHTDAALKALPAGEVAEADLTPILEELQKLPADVLAALAQKLGSNA